MEKIFITIFFTVIVCIIISMKFHDKEKKLMLIEHDLKNMLLMYYPNWKNKVYACDRDATVTDIVNNLINKYEAKIEYDVNTGDYKDSLARNILEYCEYILQKEGVRNLDLYDAMLNYLVKGGKLTSAEAKEKKKKYFSKANLFIQ